MSGCSIAIPMPSLLADDEAASAVTKPVRLASGLDAQDAQRADIAMNAALEAETSDAPVDWANPQSGSRGSFQPVDAARNGPSGLCRDFLAQVETAAAAPLSVRGSACRDVQGKWTIRTVDPHSGA